MVSGIRRANALFLLGLAMCIVSDRAGEFEIKAIGTIVMIVCFSFRCGYYYSTSLTVKAIEQGKLKVDEKYKK